MVDQRVIDIGLATIDSICGRNPWNSMGYGFQIAINYRTEHSPHRLNKS